MNEHEFNVEWEQDESPSVREWRTAQLIRDHRMDAWCKGYAIGMVVATAIFMIGRVFA